MKNPFLTNNGQILDMNQITSIWMEEVPCDEFHIFAQDVKENDWRIAEFTDKDEAKDYIKYIFDFFNASRN